MADKKVTELSAITNLSGDDLLLVVNDPSGTPTSNKVTVSRLFANVVPNVVHKGTVTARANTTFTGTTMTVSSNATFTGTLTASITKYLEVANSTATTATLVSNTNFQSYVANTNSQIATLVSNTNFQSYVANTNSQIATTLVTNTAFQSYVANTNSQLTSFVNTPDFQAVVANTNNRFNSGDFVHASFTITANGTTGYCFAGSGAANTNNETLYLYKGFTYRFVNSTGASHPFQILNTAGGSAFSNGVSGSQSGTQLFTVPHAQQSNLVYQCSIHSGMQGTLVIVS